MDRRNFVKGLLAAGAIAGVGSLSACATDDGGTSTEKPTDDYTPTRTEDTDVVVVGSGIGGFSSAIRAAQNGAKVTMVEKLSVVGGSTNVAEVVFASGSKLQRELGIEYTDLEVLRDECEFHNYRVNRILWQKLVENSGKAIDWFLGIVEPYGGGFFAVLGNEGGLQVAHAYKPTVIQATGETSTKGKGHIAILETVAKQLGVSIYTSCPAKKLVSTDGKVTGIIADNSGEIIQINAAKGVILAASGFANNQDMIAGMGRDVKQMAFVGCEGSTGDAIAMAQSVGAAHKGSLCLQFMGATLPLPSSMGDHINQVVRNEPFNLWVNQNGRRFVTEYLTIFTQKGNAVDMQNGTFSLMDEALVDFYQTYATTQGAGSYVLAGTVLDQTRSGLNGILQSQPDNAFKADTIEELAQKTGMQADTLKATIDRYNELCTKGEDTDFGKPADFLRPLTTPPYYACRLFTNLLTTVGGIQINENAQVIDENAKPIPGLFVVGSDADGFAGETYGVNLPGSTQSFGLTYGMIAGDFICGK